LQVYSKNQSLEKKYKMQYFNRLNWLAFVLTLNFINPNTGFSQSELRKTFGIKFDSLSSDYAQLDPVKLWNSNDIEMKLIKVTCKKIPNIFFVKVIKDGAILCFKDSLLKKPILLEKRNIYPFIKLDPAFHYSIQISNQKSLNGFIGLRLWCVEKNKIMDESFFCFPTEGAKFDIVSIYKSIK